MKICVVGAGVIGLSSAVRIQEKFPDTEIVLVADRFSPNTTSDVSAGFWAPYLLNHTGQPITRLWAAETLDYMARLCCSSDAKQIGAVSLSGYYMPKPEKWFTDITIGYRDMTDAELKPFPKARNGIHFTSVALDVRSYLPWLMTRFKSNGGKIVKKKIFSWDELADEFDVAVNCCGVYAGDLTADRSLMPIRGQLLRVHAPWVKHFVICDFPGEPPVYLIPGAFDCVLGGSTEHGDWNEKADVNVRERIRSGCCKFMPSLKDVKFASDWVGLRPYRPSIRIELETIYTPKNIMVVHNYGHSGSGVSLHWGCAKEAAKLVSQAITMLQTQAKL